MRLDHDWYPESLPDNVTIGERSWLYSTFAFLHYRSQRPSGVRIGNDTGVYYTTFFELGPEGEVQIGDFCTVVGAIINTNGRVVIEDYAFISHDVVIADRPLAVPPSTRGVDAPQPRVASPDILIGQNSWISARAVILGGATIGEGAIIGAAAVVDFDVPPYSLAAGNPGRIIGDTAR